MYEAFYGFTEKPFSIQPDPSFLYFGKRHSLAYTMLQYGVQNRAGFSVVTGEVGSGETTLIQHLLNNLEGDIKVGLISNTHPDIGDFLEWIMLAFEQPYANMSPVQLYEQFQKYLIAEYAQNKRVILIIDEAQNLNPKALEALRMLSNINIEKHQLLQMILVGQPELKELLKKPELRQFAQRVAVDFHLTPFNEEEVRLYIIHRLHVVGCKKSIFTNRAMKRIAEVTHGIPRSINILCDLALVYGMASDNMIIETSIIDEILQDKKEFGVLS